LGNGNRRIADSYTDTFAISFAVAESISNAYASADTFRVKL